MDKADMVTLKEAPEHFTEMLDGDPNDDEWFAFRAGPSSATASRPRP